MSEHLLSVWSVATWVLEDFWISLGLASCLLVLRATKPRRLSPKEGHLGQLVRTGAVKWSSSASTVPIFVWALEANQLQRVISSTHASMQPKMLLASMQELLGALVLLVALLGLDVLGRFVESRRQGRMLASFPASALLVVATAIADWLLCEIGWWALIHEHIDLRLP